MIRHINNNPIFDRFYHPQKKYFGGLKQCLNHSTRVAWAWPVLGINGEWRTSQLKMGGNPEELVTGTNWTSGWFNWVTWPWLKKQWTCQSVTAKMKHSIRPASVLHNCVRMWLGFRCLLPFLEVTTFWVQKHQTTPKAIWLHEHPRSNINNLTSGNLT